MRLKRIWRTNLVLILLMISLQLPALGGDTPAKDYQGTIKIGGTGGAYGVMTQVTDAFQKKYPQVRFRFAPSLGSTGGIKAAIEGALDLGLSSRPLTAAELRQGALAVEYGRSPIMLVTTHKGAGFNFTLKKIAALYLGEIKNFPDGTPIRLILRPMAESDTSFLLSLSPEIADAVRKAHTREGMIVATTDHDNAKTMGKLRGAMGWMTLTQLISEKRTFTPLVINGVRPSLETLAAGAYPYSKPFYVVTGATSTPMVKSFIQFLTSGECREILSKNGLLVDGTRP